VLYKHASGRQAGVDGKRDFAGYYADMNLWNFGHVEASLLPDGSVFAAFYAGDAQSLSVRWVRVEL
jgi:hypothetical protein